MFINVYKAVGSFMYFIYNELSLSLMVVAIKNSVCNATISRRVIR
jgi:hypothetical protein